MQKTWPNASLFDGVDLWQVLEKWSVNHILMMQSRQRNQTLYKFGVSSAYWSLNTSWVPVNSPFQGHQGSIVDMGMCLGNLLGWIMMYYWEKHWALDKNWALWVEIDWNGWEWSVQREPKVWFMQWTQCASTETILDMKQSVFECTCKPWWKANKDRSNGGSNGSWKLLELASLMSRCHVQQQQACHWKTLFVHFSRYY